MTKELVVEIMGCHGKHSKRLNKDRKRMQMQDTELGLYNVSQTERESEILLATFSSVSVETTCVYVCACSNSHVPAPVFCLWGQWMGKSVYSSSRDRIRHQDD